MKSTIFSQISQNCYRLPSWRTASLTVATVILLVGILPTSPASALSEAQLEHLYQYSYQGQGVSTATTNVVNLRGHQNATLYVDLKNDGVTTWESGGPIPLRLGVDRPRDGASMFNARNWVAANRPASFTDKVTVASNGSKTTSAATKIAPGEIGRFTFSITAPNVSGSYRLHVQPLVEGFSWLTRDAGIFWSVNVTANEYKHQWLDQSYGVPTAPDATGAVSVAIKNTGNVTWTNNGDEDTLKLAPVRPTDRNSELYHSSWQAPNRVGSFAGRARLDSGGRPQKDSNGVLQSDSDGRIEPGEAAVFSFTAKTPNRMIAANEHFNFVIEGKTWFSDVGISWPVRIGQGYASQLVGQSSYPVITKDTAPVGSLSFDFKNTGSFPWQKNGVVRLGTANPLDRSSIFAASGLSASDTLDPLQLTAQNVLPDNTANWQAGSRVGSFAGRVNGSSLDTGATTVNPGETARFAVALDARNVAAGSYREYFRLVADGFAWLPDNGTHQTITVRDSASLPQPPAPPAQPSPTPTPPTPTANPTPTPPSASSNPFAGINFYVDPNSSAKQQADAWRTSRPADAAQIDKIANRPRAMWLSGWSGDIHSTVQNRVATVKAANALPVFVAYNIPQRDCGQYSAGGSSSADAYRAWIDGMAEGIGNERAAVILEPDGIVLVQCLSEADKQRRYDLIRYAINTLEAKPNVGVYVDAGHSGWHSATETATRLNAAGVSGATGFALNVSNFRATPESTTYGTQVSAQTGGKHFIIDTSRNGNGSNGEWCNPAGRALGQSPTASTGNSLIDAYYWVKQPGESDGTCSSGPSAGTWWGDYALGLAQRAAY